MAPLAICRRRYIPALLQRLADLGLGEFFLLGKIFAHFAWLTVFGDKLRRLHIFRFPIEIKNLFLGPQKIFRMPMTVEAPGHAMRLGQIHRRHVIDGAVTTETTNAPVHMCGMIVINVIDRAIDPHPVDRIA